MAVSLELVASDGTARTLGSGSTDADGRLADLLPPGPVDSGTYRLIFETGRYRAGREEAAFFPRVIIEFTVRSPAEHHHVPLLLSPFGYSTYRGS